MREGPTQRKTLHSCFLIPLDLRPAHFLNVCVTQKQKYIDIYIYIYIDIIYIPTRASDRQLL